MLYDSYTPSYASEFAPAREPVGINRDAMLSWHLELVREFLDNQACVAEMLGDHIKNVRSFVELSEGWVPAGRFLGG